jgi:plasmid maintenance system antidote protein VapI
MSQAEFARRADLSTKHVNQIIQGDAPITADTAIALELVTDVPAEVWNGLEAHYAATTKRLATRRELADEDRAWVRAMPVRDLIRRRLLPDAKDIGARFDGLLRFFGVANRNAWKAIWVNPEASFHDRPHSAPSPRRRLPGFGSPSFVLRGSRPRPSTEAPSRKRPRRSASGWGRRSTVTLSNGCRNNWPGLGLPS